MDSAAAALLGMGLAAAGFAGAGVGIGYIFGKMIEAVARQPEAEARVGKYMWIGFALVEAIALYGLVIAFIIMGLCKRRGVLPSRPGSSQPQPQPWLLRNHAAV
jgi:F-type H+-transporting ATPase subunit c